MSAERMDTTRKDLRIEQKDTPHEIEGDIVRSPRDVEYEAFLHPGLVETYSDLVHIAEEDDDDVIGEEEEEDYRHAFIPYYG